MNFEDAMETWHFLLMQCYKDAGTPVLVEGVHFSVHLPDKHFFDDLNNGFPAFYSSDMSRAKAYSRTSLLLLLLLLLLQLLLLRLLRLLL